MRGCLRGNSRRNRPRTGYTTLQIDRPSSSASTSRMRIGTRLRIACSFVTAQRTLLNSQRSTIVLLEVRFLAELRQLRIANLHGAFDVTIPIRGNRLILVGVNGLGKNTCVNALYFVLSRQWPRLLQIQFDEIELQIDNSAIKITRPTIEEELSRSDSEKGGMPHALRRRVDILRANDLLETFVEAREEELSKFTHAPGCRAFEYRPPPTGHASRKQGPIGGRDG